MSDDQEKGTERRVDLAAWQKGVDEKLENGEAFMADIHATGQATAKDVATIKEATSEIVEIYRTSKKVVKFFAWAARVIKYAAGLIAAVVGAWIAWRHGVSEADIHAIHDSTKKH